MVFTFNIINRNSSSVTKVSWIVLILGFPLVGVSLFLLFGKDRFSKKIIKKYEKSEKIYKNHCKNGESRQINNNLSNNHSDLVSFIFNANKIPVYSNTSVKYLKNGEEYFKSLIYDLKNATKFIFLQYFIISKGEIWKQILDILKQKVNEEVEVFIIYDDLGSIKYLEANFDKKLQKMGIKCVKFNKFIPLLSIFQNIRCHQKIAIIDNKVVYIGGINIGDEYANIIKPFGYWKDCGLKFEGDAVESATKQFLKMYCFCSNNYEIDISKYLINNISKSNGIVLPFYSSPYGLDNNLVSQNVYKYFINKAKKSLYITTPYLIVDYGIINDLIFAVKRGVDVRIVIPSVPDKKITYLLTKQNAKYLLENGVKIYSYSKGFIHSKNLICDDVCVVGSTNFDYRSFLHQFENGVVLFDCVANEEIKNDFKNIFKQSTLLKDKDLYFNFVKRIYVSILKIIAPLL